MDSLRARRILGLAIFLISVVLLAWGVWPNSTLSRSVMLPPFEPTLTSINDYSSAVPVHLQRPTLITNQSSSVSGERTSWQLVLTQPASVRRGDAAIVQLRLDVAGESPADPLLPAPVEHNILVEARLELPGLVIHPAEAVNQPLSNNQGLSFFWRINPDLAGRYTGTAWLHLRFIPAVDGSESQPGSEIRRAIYAGPVDVQVVELFGLGGFPARWLGGMGMIAGALLGLDEMAASGLAYLRLKRRITEPNNHQKTDV